MYFQDESRFGTKSHIGRCLTAKGVKAKVIYQHGFKNTYLYGSYSPITGDSYVWEIDGVDSYTFEDYLTAFSKRKPKEFKIVVINNAGFHNALDIEIPENIFLLRLPPYSPELNPSEQIWQHIKGRFKNQLFETLEDIKDWLYETVRGMDRKLIKSIVGNHHYLAAFNVTFNG